jgi:transcriptional regulator CtsR
MIPTWEQLHAAILQQMDESEKQTGARKATKGALAFRFGCAGGQSITYYITTKYAKEFAEKFVCVKSGRGGGIYLKEDAEKGLVHSRNRKSCEPIVTNDVESLIQRLDTPVEKKSVETLLIEQIRMQIDRNAQFADRILQIAMEA